MIPGTTTKVSEFALASTTVLDPKTDVVFLTGTTGIDTIIPHFGGGFSGLVILIPLDGDVNVSTTGNVALATTCYQNAAMMFIYSKTHETWYPCYCGGVTLGERPPGVPELLLKKSPVVERKK